MVSADKIVYLRGSTDEQEYTIGAQLTDIHRHVPAEQIVRVYVEHETATDKRHRPVLAEALAHCKAINGRLVVAKLDRFSRNKREFANMVHGIRMPLFVDMPLLTDDSNSKLMTALLVAFAEYEVDQNSDRTKRGLRQAKAQGVMLGRPKPAAAVRMLARQLRADGHTLLSVSALLAAEGHVAPSGNPYSASSVKCMLTD